MASYYQILSQDGIKNSKMSLKSIQCWFGSHWKKCTAGVINAQCDPQFSEQMFCCMWS